MGAGLGKGKGRALWACSPCVLGSAWMMISAGCLGQPVEGRAVHSGVGFRFAGSISVQPGPALAQAPRWEGSVEVSILGSTWKIHVRNQTQKQEFLYGCDGTNVYVIQAFLKPGFGAGGPVLNGSVYPGQLPPDPLPQVWGLWWAWCSGPWTARQSAGPDGLIPLPSGVLPPTNSATSVAERARWLPLEPGGRFPHRVEVLTLTAGAPSRPGPNMSGAKPSVILRVIRTGIRAGAAVPTGWVYELYGVRGAARGAEREPLWVLNCEAETVEPLDHLDPLPNRDDPVQTIRVSDYRFHDPERRIPLTYRMTGWHWFTDAQDPNLLQLWENQRATLERLRSRPRLPYGVVLVLFLSLLASPLLFRSIRSFLAESLIRTLKD